MNDLFTWSVSESILAKSKIDCGASKSITSSFPWCGPSEITNSNLTQIRTLKYIIDIVCKIIIWRQYGNLFKKCLLQKNLLLGCETHFLHFDLRIINLRPIRESDRQLDIADIERLSVEFLTWTCNFSMEFHLWRKSNGHKILYYFYFKMLKHRI